MTDVQISLSVHDHIHVISAHNLEEINVVHYK